MTKSTAVRDAADRLHRALQNLETSLTPLVSKVNDLERANDAAKSFEADRAKMATQLDEAAAREKEYIDREKEFASLARETTSELDTVISQVLLALGDGA